VTPSASPLANPLRSCPTETAAPPALALDEAATGFVFQGHLLDAGLPAKGFYDFTFTLYDAASDGKPLGSRVAVEDASVSDGYFSLELDFGDVFDGTALWLDAAARRGAD
jgi:hypothetical protein